MSKVKKKVSQKEYQRRKRQSDLTKFGFPLYTPDGEYFAEPKKADMN